MLPVIFTGIYIGEIIGFPLSTVMVNSHFTINGNSYGGWPATFYVFGVCGILWYPLWSYLAYETPDAHPHITKEELDYINSDKAKRDSSASASVVAAAAVASANCASSDNEAVNASAATSPMHSASKPTSATATSSSSSSPVSETSPDAMSREEIAQLDEEFRSGHGAELAEHTPWKAFFTHPAALTLLVNNWTLDWIGFTLLSEIPTYLTDQLNFSSSTVGYFSMLPYVALFMSTLFYGEFFEHLQLKYGWPARRVRQWAQFLTIGMSSAALVVCVFVDNSYGSLAFIIFSQLFFGADAPGIGCAYSDVSPRYSEMLNTIGNTVGAAAGIVGPLVVAGFRDASGDTIWGWRAAFLLTFAMVVFSLLLWRRFQTSDIVPELNNPVPKRRRKETSRSLQLPLLEV